MLPTAESFSVVNRRNVLHVLAGHSSTCSPKDVKEKKEDVVRMAAVKIFLAVDLTTLRLAVI
jgi:hypothetical protein